MNKRLYTLSKVEEYIERNGYEIEYVLEGVLIDSYILYHDGIWEVFEETYVNSQTSAYQRHIYRKGLPDKWVWRIQAQQLADEEV